MARTFVDAFADADSPALDLAVGFEKPPREYVVSEAVHVAWHSFAYREFTEVAEQMAHMYGAPIQLAEDAVQDTLLILAERDPSIFEDDPREIIGRVSKYGRKRLMKLKAQQRQSTTRSLSVLLETDGSNDHPLNTARPAIAYTRVGVDEEARNIPAPPPGPGSRGSWNRSQVVGAVQRFRDDHGRAPRMNEFRNANGLPSWASMKQLGFADLQDLFLEAGVPVEVSPPTKTWTTESAAKACLRFRRREGYWPNGTDARRLPNSELPHETWMERFFGGTRAINVQLGTESTLGRIDAPKEETSGQLTAMLRRAAAGIKLETVLA